MADRQTINDEVNGNGCPTSTSGYFRRALAVLPAMRTLIDQRKVQAALSALRLFLELLGFRFRKLTDTDFTNWHGLKISHSGNQ
jgi:hypothetical protein